MVNLGLIEEIKSLLNNGISKDNQCMQAIGYKEILDYLDGNCNLSQAIETIKLNTRHYAKRQITFFKKLSVEKLAVQSPQDMAKYIVQGLKL